MSDRTRRPENAIAGRAGGAHVGERPESAYEDRPAPEPPDSDDGWDGFSGPAAGGAAVTPAKPSAVDDPPGQSEREREGGGAAGERD